MKHINSTCLIDDDHIFIYAVKRILKTSQLCDDFTVFNNGEDAINGLKKAVTEKQHIPDLILLDINMPIMDGWQFLDEFKKLKTSKKITLYIVSSSVDPADLNKAKEYEQITDFIVKPITRSNLIKTLEQIDIGQ
ncbi:response regulator [Olleya sp. Bg11-27]|uniref:response regulator n=1 Tax=Olleya sp. Bg11-27 TaxID=2058135 RepID=UPI000C313C3E|nr:response regulator [Olleya sp. Bg11-27]AUC74357.1 response regulator [Olleya sp. Bg11-27]